MTTAKRVLRDRVSARAAEVALDAELEQAARDFAAKNEYPKSARMLMRKVLLLLDRRVRQAEDRGVRWGLDHCHDLAVAAGLGRPNTTVDRDAVAAEVAARARGSTDTRTDTDKPATRESP